VQQSQPAVPISSPKAPTRVAGWIARAKAWLAVRETQRGRFTRRDARYDFRRGEVAIGSWLVDRATAEFGPSLWPIRRATLHWRLHELVVSNALNFEFQIDGEVPFAHLTKVTIDTKDKNVLIFYFDEVMRITVGISELGLSFRHTDRVRTDWGVKGWTFAFGSSRPVPTT
jgi:hypothetical protein